MAAGFEDGEGVIGFGAEFESFAAPTRLIRAGGLQEEAVAVVANVGIEDDDGAGDLEAQRCGELARIFGGRGADDDRLAAVRLKQVCN